MYFQEYPFTETIYKPLSCTIIKTEIMRLAGPQNNKSLQIRHQKVQAICCAALKSAVKYLQILHYLVTDFWSTSAFMSHKHLQGKKKLKKKPRHIIYQSTLINHLHKLVIAKNFSFTKILCHSWTSIALSFLNYLYIGQVHNGKVI